MKKITFLIFFITLLFSKFSTATKIIVVNIESLIGNNSIYQETINEIESIQKISFQKFENYEIELQNLLKEIEESKLVLNENQINKKIEKYNIEFRNFSDLVENFNLHYQNEIINIKEKILKEIIVLLEKYAKDNQVDLILDSNSYLIASNSINITEIISDELSKVQINLNFNEFKHN